MFRFICFLLNKSYEPCKSCETLKEQLQYEREEKQRLTDTLINILQPKTVEQPVVELNPIQQSGGPFARRRAAREAQDRLEANILKSSTVLGKPDIKAIENINELEKELNITTDEETKEA